MDPAIVSAMAAVLGSLVGGTASIVTAWVTQRTTSKRDMIRAEIHRREALDDDFIRECSKLIIDSYVHTLEGPKR